MARVEAIQEHLINEQEVSQAEKNLRWAKGIRTAYFIELGALASLLTLEMAGKIKITGFNNLNIPFQALMGLLGSGASIISLENTEKRERELNNIRQENKAG